MHDKLIADHKRFKQRASHSLTLLEESINQNRINKQENLLSTTSSSLNNKSTTAENANGQLSSRNLYENDEKLKNFSSSSSKFGILASIIQFLLVILKNYFG